MVQSMTGYGRGAWEEKDFSFQIEIKTVNHRYAELALRLPRFLNPVENRIRKQLLGKISRGHADVFVTAVYTGTEGRQVKVDKGLAKAYHDSLKELAHLLGSPEEASRQELFFIAGCEDVLVPEEGTVDLDRLWPGMEQAIGEALDRLLAMRKAEGEQLAADLEKRIGTIETQLRTIETRPRKRWRNTGKGSPASSGGRSRKRGQDLWTKKPGDPGSGPLRGPGERDGRNRPAPQPSPAVPAAAPKGGTGGTADGFPGPGNEPGSQHHSLQGRGRPDHPDHRGYEK